MTRRNKDKLDNTPVTHHLLHRTIKRNEGMGFPKPKWVLFCEVMLARGYNVTIKEAQETVSKYVKVHGINDDYYLVRFSNHAPNKYRELRGDCDFFVGKTHTGVRNTNQAIDAVFKHFGAEPYAEGHERVSS